MTTKSFISRIGDLLQKTEMFERPWKKIPGKWQLYEYFVDSGEELIHIQESELMENKEFFEIECFEKRFSYTSNIPVSFVQNIKKGNWNVAKNFVVLMDESNFRNNAECQFAFEKGNLKLLKKDGFGKIEFFGFFRKLSV